MAIDPLSSINCLTSSRPRIPHDVQRLIVEALGSPIFDLETGISGDPTVDGLTSIREVYHDLRSCSLVSRAWASFSQKVLFSFVFVETSAQLDRLFPVVCDPNSPRLAHHIRRIVVRYLPPYFKMGEALPRIAAMKLPELFRLELAAPLGIDPDAHPCHFAFHHAYSALLSPLRNVQVLHLKGICLSNLTELRRLIAAFRGIQAVDLDEVSTGEHRDRDFRPLFLATKSSLHRVQYRSCPSVIYDQTPALWISCPTSARLRNVPNAEHEGVPSISEEVAHLIACFRPLSSSRRQLPEMWEWQPPLDPHQPCQCLYFLQTRGLTIFITGSLVSRVDAYTVTRHFRFAWDHSTSKHYSAEHPSNPTFGLINLIGIRVENAREIAAVDGWWLPLINAVEELASLESKLRNMEEVGLHFHSYRGGRHPEPDFLDYIQTIIMPLKDTALESRLVVTINKIPLGYLLRSLPRLDLEIQLAILGHIVEENKFLASQVSKYEESENSAATDKRPLLSVLAACSLVCSEWRRPSQSGLYAWIILDNSSHFDHVYHMLLPRTSTAPHLIQHVCRISIQHASATGKSPLDFGQVLQRIANLGLPNLREIDLLQDPAIGEHFPFPPSLLLHVSRFRFHPLRALHLRGFRFTSLDQLRRLLSAFRGLETATLSQIRLGEHVVGDFRPLRHYSGLGLRQVLQYRADTVSPDLSTLEFWIAPYTDPRTNNTSKLAEASQPQPCPVLSTDMMALIGSFHIFRPKSSHHFVECQWTKRVCSDSSTLCMYMIYHVIWSYLTACHF